MRILLTLAIVLWLVSPAMAGTAEDPEITDPADDMTYGGMVPVMQPPAGVTVGLNSDLLSAWIEDLGDALLFSATVQGTGAPTTTSSSLYTFSFAVDGTAYEATVHVGAASPAGSGAVAPGGVASAATSDGGRVTATVAKSAIGDPGPGAVVDGFVVDAEGRLLDEVSEFTVDRAPDSGAGRPFTIPGGSDETAGNDTIPNGTINGTDAPDNATAPPSPPVSNGTDEDAGTPAETNATGNETVQQVAKETPVAWFVPAVGLGVAAAARRRR